MIRAGRASLAVTFDETDPEVVTQHLGLSPTEVVRKGDASRSGRIHAHNVWALDVGTLSNDDGDHTGTTALRVLLDRCRPAFGRIPSLPVDCHARIVWSADSDSTQGGFVLPAELAAQIAALGVDVYATVYLDEAEATDT